MNQALRDALRTQAECRQAWNALTEESTTEQETEARTALEAADQLVLEALDAMDAPDDTTLELRDRVSLGRYLDGIANERTLDGAEAELRQEVGLTVRSAGSGLSSSTTGGASYN